MPLQEYLDFMQPYLGSDVDFAAFVQAMDVPLPKTMKVLGSRIDQAAFERYARNVPLSYQHTQFPDLQDMFVVDQGNIPLGKQIAHLLGWFYIQELAASLPAHFMDIASDSIVLDMSAAPGGKTIQLADALLACNKIGIVWANDLDAKRLPVLENNLDRTGMYNACVSKYSATVFGQTHPEFFDNVLLDAPCSGEGTGFKSDAAYKWRKPAVIERIASLQYQLLQSAIQTCKPGGSIIYSTCTLNPLENEATIDRILALYGDHVSVEHLDCIGTNRGLSQYPAIAPHVLRCRPHIQKTGGFFVCKLRKKDSTLLGQKGASRVGHLSYFAHGDDVQSSVCRYLFDTWGIVVDTNKYLFVRTPHHICVTSPQFVRTASTANFDRVGVPILKGKDSNDWRPLHQLGIIFGTIATNNVLVLDKEQVEKYVAGQDFAVDSTMQGFLILQWYDRGVGVGKIVHGMLKNKFMKLL